MIGVSYDLLVVLSPSLSSAFVIYHHATELALMFAGLLPHDGSAGGGGAAGHGCCRGKQGRNTGERRKKEHKCFRKYWSTLEEHNVWLPQHLFDKKYF